MSDLETMRNHLAELVEARIKCEERHTAACDAAWILENRMRETEVECVETVEALFEIREKIDALTASIAMEERRALRELAGEGT